MDDGQNGRRLGMAATGAAAGLALWLLAETVAWETAGRAVLCLTVFVWVLSASVLLLTGPMRAPRAALAAFGVSLLAAALAVLASLSERAAFDLTTRPLDWLAGLAVVTIPLPFLIAADRPQGWRHYPTLFAESWGIVMRAAAGLIFTGLVWAVILLSDAMLRIVGLELLAALLDIDPLPWVVTGAILGVSLAVLAELQDYLAPGLILRLLRLLVIPVLLVMALFIAALPVAGLSGLLGGASVTLTLLAMVAAAATLVTAALDRDDGVAAHGAVMRRAVQALALILPLPAALAAYALWLRVDQYGWTPERIFVALVALPGLGYGLSYAAAVIARRHWMARIRRANATMALVLAGLAALWLTPIVDAERIAARDQLARFETGRTPLAALDLAALDRWGAPGAEARARLEARAAEPGQEALAALLAGSGVTVEDDPATARAARLAALLAVMPLQPPGATASRDILLQALPTEEIARWTDLCRGPTPDGRPACILAVADLWPAEPGEEAVFLARDPSGWVEVTGIGLRGGEPVLRPVVAMDGAPLDPTAGMALLRSLQDAPAPVSAAPLNRIGRGDPATGLVLLP